MCDYTEDYGDEPPGVICAEIKGQNVLIDIDEYMEGYDPNESRCPCPNCDMDAHVEYLVDVALLDKAHVSSYKKRKAAVVAERMREIQTIHRVLSAVNDNHCEPEDIHD